jgi:integrase
MQRFPFRDDHETMKAQRFPLTVTEGGVSAKIRKLTQIKGGKAYTVFIVDYVLLGKRRQVGRSDFEDAKQVALEACRQIANGQQMSLSLANADLLEYRRAQEALTPLGIKLDAAAHEYANAVALLGGRASLAEVCRDWLKVHARQLPHITVSEAVEKLVEQAGADGKSAARLHQLRVLLDRFAESFQCQVHTLTPRLVSEYLSSLLLSERSKRNHRDVIGFFNRWLILRGYLPKGADWLEGVQRYTARKLGEIEIYSPQEMTRLLLAAGDMTPFFAISAFAGLRHAEIARLDWREIDLDDGFIEVRAAKSKTGERRLVPVHDNLKNWLLPYRQPHGKVVSYANTTKQLLRVAKATGLKATDTAPAIPAVEWKHNALRHSFISYRVAECADVPRVSDEAGNSPQMIRQHYLRRVKPAESVAWFAIQPPQNAVVSLPLAA